jgi:hypothetical protein
MPYNPTMEALATLTDDEVALNIDPKNDHVTVEFSRRLVTTNKELIQAIRDFESASDKASGRLLFVTWVLVGLTVAIVGLTGVLVWIGLA